MRWLCWPVDATVGRCALLCALVLTPLLAAAAAAAAAELENGLISETTKAVQCARAAQNGDTLKVHYRGTLASNGKEFDASNEESGPIEFMLGAGQVIRGWDLGLVGMCIGEKRRLTIPPELAYGDREIGLIPKGSTLIFETELVEIKGVNAEDKVASDDSMPASNSEGTATVTVSVPQASTPTPSKDGPVAQGEAGAEDGVCRLLGPFALVVQAALGGLAALSLVWKRWRESPRRPLKIWWFDVSKQVVGSVLLHAANLFMSMLSSGDFRFPVITKPDPVFVQDDRRNQPNPCSFYLLNLAIDTTIGIPILILLLRLLHRGALLTPLARPPESIKSGNYGQPPQASWWVKQSLIYFIGLLGMKLCVFFIFTILPWIAWVGDWALRWTEGNEAVQITFVMFIFPLIMNAIQYYIIDSFIKDPAGGSGEHHLVPQNDAEDDEEEESRHRRASDDDASSRALLDAETRKRMNGEETKALLEENDSTVPRSEENGALRDSGQSSRGSTR